MRMICGILSSFDTSASSEVALRARDISTSYTRWHYPGRIVVGATVDQILAECAAADSDICFIQGAGHVVPDRWSPKQEMSKEFVPALERFAAESDFLVAGEAACKTGVGEDGAMSSRRLLVNLKRYRESGCPPFDTQVKGAEWIRASRRLGLPIRSFDALRELMLDLGPDLNADPAFLEGLASRSARSNHSLFPWNFELYDDIVKPPPTWRGPVSRLYSVASALKPHLLLQTHGISEKTRVIFFDYSDCALKFQQLLHQDWDGTDYPSFLKRAKGQMPADTLYYLWPGAELDDTDSEEAQALWSREVDRWGGQQSLKQHWAQVRRLKFEFVPCNLLVDSAPLLDRMDDQSRSVLWWSNSFHTAFTAFNYSLEGKRAVYEAWIRSVAEKAPSVFLYGSDHSNACVNGMTAREYVCAYDAVGGDPLDERRLYRHWIRF